MRTEHVTHCPVCGASGTVLYSQLTDRLFGTDGTWEIRRCDEIRCQTLWMDPRPVKEDVSLAYADYYTHGSRVVSQSALRRSYDWLAKGYAVGRFGAAKTSISGLQRMVGCLMYMLPGKRAVIDYLAGHLPVPNNGRLLEIGCGSGDALEFMRSMGWEVCGVEVDPASAAVAKAKGLDVRVGGLSEHAFPSGSFDAIAMNHVIEHLFDPKDVLAECRRLLRQGGTLVVVTPNTRSFCHRIFRDAWMHLDPPRHLQLFSSAALERLITSAGFELRESFSSIRDANGVYLGSRSIRLTGSHKMGSCLPMRLRVMGILMQLFEFVLKKFDRQAGEEIVVIADRP